MTYIYILERNNIPFYVGKTNTKNQRKSHHKKRWGYDIKFYIIDEVEDSCWKFWEVFYISLFKTWGFELENKNNGGGGPTSWTEEQKSKINPDRINKIKNNKDRGNKISQTLLERDHSKYYTDEIKAKISKSKINITLPPRTESHKNNHIESIRQNTNKIKQYSLDGVFVKEWRSMGEAAELIFYNRYNIKHTNYKDLHNIVSNIRDCCLGKIRSCSNHIWKYSNDETQIIPKYRTIYQFDNNLDQTRIFLTNKELQTFLFEYKKIPQIIFKIKTICNQKSLKKINKYYYSYEQKIK